MKRRAFLRYLVGRCRIHDNHNWTGQHRRSIYSASLLSDKREPDIFDDPDPSPDFWEGLARTFQARAGLHPPVFLIPGNHDLLTSESVWAPGHPFRAKLPQWVHDPGRQRGPLGTPRVGLRLSVHAAFRRLAGRVRVGAQAQPELLASLGSRGRFPARAVVLHDDGPFWPKAYVLSRMKFWMHRAQRRESSCWIFSTGRRKWQEQSRLVKIAQTAGSDGYNLHAGTI
jgi:hypothetical protein